MPQCSLDLLRIRVVGDQRGRQEVPQRVEATVLLRPPRTLAPLDPLARPGAVGERVPVSRGEQQRDVAPLQLAGVASTISTTTGG